MLVSIILMSIGFILMILFIIGKLTNYSLKVTFIKALASSTFVALAFYLFFAKGYLILGIFFIVASFLGLVGDTLLGLKRFYKSKANLLNYGGFLCFASGHIVYIVGIFSYFYLPGHYLVTFLPFIAAILFSGAIIVFRKYLNLDFGNKNIPTFIYIILVGSLFFSSFALLWSYSFKNNVLLLLTIGSFCFLVSDLMLCKSYFGKYHKVESAIYSVLYYIAQFMIVFSLFFI